MNPTKPEEKSAGKQLLWFLGMWLAGLLIFAALTSGLKYVFSLITQTG